MTDDKNKAARKRLDDARADRRKIRVQQPPRREGVSHTIRPGLAAAPPKPAATSNPKPANVNQRGSAAPNNED